MRLTSINQNSHHKITYIQMENQSVSFPNPAPVFILYARHAGEKPCSIRRPFQSG